MLNFNWWVNRKDPAGRNVFAGGFLGLDNIGVFDRSAQLPTGGSLEQADGTAWMAFYCQCMLEMALILTEYDAMYEEVAFKFVQHFMWISYAMDRIGEHHDEMWDEEDGFFYDLLRLPDGQAMRLKVRSLVGLLPLCASTVFEGDAVTRYPKLMEMIDLFRKRHPELVSHVAPTDKGFIGVQGPAAAVDPQQEEAGARARVPARRERVPRTARHPVALALSPRSSVHVPRRPRGVQGAVPAGRIEHGHVRRELQLAGPGVDAGQRADRPGAAEPVPVLRRRLQGGVPHRLGPVHDAVRGRAGDRAAAAATFLRDANGRRPVYGGTDKFQDDPHWRDLILFYEYFHGDNGAGLGASHQTGWTGLVALLLDLFGRVDAKAMLETERGRLTDRLVQGTGRRNTGRRLTLADTPSAGRLCREQWKKATAAKLPQGTVVRLGSMVTRFTQATGSGLVNSSPSPPVW